MRVLALVLIALAVSCGRGEEVHLSGRLDGGDTAISIMVSDQIYAFAVDKNAHFSGEIPLKENTYATIVPYGYFIYLAPGEDLEIVMNNNVSSSVQYKGSLAAINNYLNEQRHNTWFDYKQYQDDEEAFVRKVQAQIDRQILLLEAKNLGADFTTLEKQRILYRYAEQASYYPRLHQLDSGNYQPGPVFDDFINSFPVDGDELIDLPGFKTFVLNYATYRGRDLNVKHLINYILRRWDNGKVRDYLLTEITYNYLREKGMAEADYLLSVCWREVRDSLMLEKVNRIADRWRRLSAGVTAPEVGLINESGTFQLRDFRGSYLYICVWNPWTSPWESHAGAWNHLVDEYKGKNIRFLTFAISRYQPGEQDSMSRTVEGEHFRVAQPSEFMQDYMINTTPRYLLIDPHGQIIGANVAEPSDAIKLLLDNLGL